MFHKTSKKCIVDEKLKKKCQIFTSPHMLHNFVVVEIKFPVINKIILYQH